MVYLQYNWMVVGSAVPSVADPHSFIRIQLNPAKNLSVDPLMNCDYQRRIITDEK